MKNIIAYYNKLTKKPICYIIGIAVVTTKLEKSFEFNDVDYSDLIKSSKQMLKSIYNGDDHGNLLEHEFFHIKEDYFNNIKKSDVEIILRSRNEEFQHIRKLKIHNITL